MPEYARLLGDEDLFNSNVEDVVETRLSISDVLHNAFDLRHGLPVEAVPAVIVIWEVHLLHVIEDLAVVHLDEDLHAQ
jgi:hypothetical protein